IWWKEAEPVIATKAYEVSWADFLDAWDRVRFTGQLDWTDVLEEASRAAIPGAASRYSQDGQRLVAICSVLQRLHGAKPFFLAPRTAGQLLGISAETARLIFRAMQRDGLLERIEPGSRVGGMATTWRFHAHAE